MLTDLHGINAKQVWTHSFKIVSSMNKTTPNKVFQAKISVVKARKNETLVTADKNELVILFQGNFLVFLIMMICHF